MYPIEVVADKDGQHTHIIMKAGAALGITLNSTFDIYKTLDDSTDPDKKLGTLVAKEPKAFETALEGVIEQELGGKGWAIQALAGEEEDLRLHVAMDARLLPVFERLAEEMQSRAGEKRRILLVDKETAELDISFNEEDKVIFHVLKGLCTRYGHIKLPYALSPNVDEIYPVIRAAAHYYWHLNRSTEKPALSTKVDVEVLRMSEVDELNADLLRVVRPVEPIENLNRANVVDICVDSESDKNMYGFKLTNRSTHSLYVSAFYFDNSDFRISASSPYSSRSYAALPIVVYSINPFLCNSSVSSATYRPYR